ncbi:hypothetical protein [Kutzneria sp. NPDC052558]|uniref:VG15 protein n=1 Tax=Kutzneria sp. NPDC052558 TaxID=3364121 RepID=UPI0037C78F59
MAVLTAERITEDYRRAQVKVAAVTVANVLALWPLLDPFRLGDTVDDWLRQVLGVVDRQRDRSISLSQQYYQQLRTVEVGRAAGRPRPPAPTDPKWTNRTVASVLATGPSAIKSLSGNGIPPKVAADRAASEVAAAAARQVSNAGRAEVERTARADPVAVGWRRQTSANPCFWCAMLASRPVLYDTKQTALGGRPDAYHSGCLCVAVPVFRHGTPLPDQAQAFGQLWRASTRGTAGKASVRAFRRAYYAQQKAAQQSAAPTLSE